MELLAYCIVFFLILRTFISLVNLFSGLHLPDKKPTEYPKVSLLIPARNEEAVLGQLMTSLLKQDYPDLEIFVCNDHSSDKTEEILNCFVGEDKRVQWFFGKKLPDNWLGKNYACHQLAEKALGKYLIFLDADVELSSDAVSKSVASFQNKKLALLSVFPQQKMETFAEWATVPVMNWILQSLLPMILVQKLKYSSLAAANGQFMMFDAENYRINRWHEKVKNQPVEDIRIARMIKANGFKMSVLLGNRDIYCRMYRNWSESILGFSRNIHEYFGGNRLVMFGFWMITGFGPFILCSALGFQFLIYFIVLIVINRFLVALAGWQNSFWSVLMHPLQMFSFTVLVFYNIYRRIRKDTEWKGRKIKFQD